MSAVAPKAGMNSGGSSTPVHHGHPRVSKMRNTTMEDHQDPIPPATMLPKLLAQDIRRSDENGPSADMAPAAGCRALTSPGCPLSSDSSQFVQETSTEMHTD